jgi:hypothetical protein
VYPNPTAGQIQLSNDSDIEKLEWFLMNGQCIGSEAYRGGLVTVPTEIQRKQMVLLRITTSEKVVVKKVARL